MLLKRLSIALCALMCFSGFVMGTNTAAQPDANPNGEENVLLAPLAVDFEATPKSPRCFNDKDGFFEILISDPFDLNDLSYSYLIIDKVTGLPADSGNRTGLNFSTNAILASGTYYVRVRELSSSTDIPQKERIVLPKLKIDVTGSSISPSCSGNLGTITINASGGNGGYNFYLNYGQTNQLSPVNQTTNPATFSIANSGTYTAYVEDTEGCPGTSDLTYTVTIPEPISPRVVVGTINCPGGTANITLNSLPSDPNSYNILLDGVSPSVIPSGTSATLNNVSAGSYSLTIERTDCSGDNWTYPDNPIVIDDFLPINFTWDNNPNNISIKCFDEDTTLTVTLNGGKAGVSINLSLKDNLSGDTTLLTGIQVNNPYPFKVKKGNYTLIAEIPSCSYTKNSDPFIIGGPSKPFEITNQSKTDVKCPGGSDGTITLDYEGGTSPIRYKQNGLNPIDLPSNKTITGLSDDAYSIVLIDNNSCETPVPAVLVIIEPDPINVSLLLTQALTCPNGNNGILTANTSGGGSGGYRYTLERNGVVVPDYDNVSGDSVRDFTGLIEGDYEVKVNTQGCADQQSDQEIIPSIDDVTIGITYTPVLCRDTKINDFNISATGGDGSKFTYYLTNVNGNIPHPNSPKTEANSGTGVDFDNIDPGETYRIEVSIGTCGVVASRNTTIYNPPVFNVSYPSEVNLRCYNGDTTIVISASGKSPFEISSDNGVTFLPFNNSNTNVLNSLTEGTYAYKLRDGNGCEFNNGISIKINPIDQISVNVLTVNPRVKCFNEASGEVELEIKGGNAPYTVEVLGSGRPKKLTDNNGFIKFTSLPIGNNYDVHIIDDGGCEVTLSSVFSVDNAPSSLSISPSYNNLLNCFGDSTLLQVDIVGGWPSNDYSVLITGGNNINEDLISPSYSINLKYGTYYINVTDNLNGCIAKDTIEIEQPNELKFTSTIPKNVSCFNENDASISFSISGGTGIYYWGLNNAATEPIVGNSFTIDNSIFPLPADSYNLYITDYKGCYVNPYNFTITEPDPITFDTIIFSVSCFNGNDGRIRIVDVEGGSGTGYTSLITPAGGTQVARTLDITGLTKGIYEIIVVDNSGTCSSEPKSVEIKEPTEIVILGHDEIDIKCYNVHEGFIRINAQGGIPYDLEYRITNDTGYDSGYSTNNEFNMLGPGVYTAWVRNSKKNCAQEYPTKINIDNAAELIVNTPIVTDVSCHNLHDGKAIIQATGGTGQLTYTLTNTAPVISNTDGIFTGLGEDNRAVTNYDYIVEDINGCSKSDSFQVRNPEPIALAITGRTEILCNNNMNGTLSLMVTGGTVTTASSYALSDYDNPSINYIVEPISGNEFKIKGLGNTGTVAFYNPVATDNNGCQTDPLAAPEEFVNPKKVIIDSVSIGKKLCYGNTNDTTIIYASGGTGKFRYSLNNGLKLSELEDSLFIGEEIGLKQPYVVDENACVATANSYEYVQPDKFEVEYEFFPIQCYDDQYGDMKLEIKGGTGNYELSINDPNFNTETDLYDIYRSQKDITQFALLENNILLRDDKVFKFYLRDANKCHVQNIEDLYSYTKPFADTIFVIPEKLVLVGLEMRSVNCRDENTGVIIFEATGGTVTTEQGYILQAVNIERNQSKFNSNGSNQVDKLFAGLHRCYLTDANGCIGETKLTPAGYDFDTISVAYANESIYLEVSNIIVPTCDITFDGSLEINVADYSQDGVTAYVEKLNPKLNVYNQFDEPDTILADPDYKRVINEDNILYFANSVKIADHMGIGRYLITVEDNYTGCATSLDTLFISRDGDDCPKLNNYNAFTPHNGDLLNDNFTIFGSQYQEYKLQIYTSWGELVYSNEGVADDEGVKWNGVDNSGRPVPVGTYIYRLHKQLSAQEDTTIINNITILRGDGRR